MILFSIINTPIPIITEQTPAANKEAEGFLRESESEGGDRGKWYVVTTWDIWSAAHVRLQLFVLIADAKSTVLRTYFDVKQAAFGGNIAWSE